MADPGQQDAPDAGSLEHWRERALAAERWRDEVWAPLNERLAADARAEALAGELDSVRANPAWRATAPLEGRRFSGASCLAPAQPMSARKVTVAIPVLNGERYLDEVLSAVRAQEVDADVEILIVDSGSEDESLEIARRHGAVIHEIPRASFSHGGTRNHMMELAAGDHVAFLTQDATPAGSRWLASLLAGFDLADDVALSFGPHVARPDASHMIKAEMRRHFAAWEDDGGPSLQRLERSDEALAAYRSAPWRLQFFSDTNGAVARWAWERVPYRSVPYAEDQLIAREMIEAGFAKAYHPEAAVLHSHDYPPVDFFRRYFDEFRSLREVLGFVAPVGARQTPRHVKGLVLADRAYLRDVEGLSKRQSLRPLAVSLRHHSARAAGEVLGTRADALPRSVRRMLSLEGRDSFVPVEIPESPLLEDAPREDPQPPQGEYWDFVRSAFPRRPLELEPWRDLAAKPSLKLAFVVPAWKPGSGGHTTIFRIIQMLERRGHDCVIHVFDPMNQESRPAHELRADIARHFLKLRAPVLRGFDRWAGPTWPSRRTGGPPTRCGTSPSAPRRHTSCRTTSPTSTRARRSRSGRRRPTAWTSAASRTRLGWPACCASGTGSTRLSSSAARTS